MLAYSYKQVVRLLFCCSGLSLCAMVSEVSEGTPLPKIDVGQCSCVYNPACCPPTPTPTPDPPPPVPETVPCPNGKNVLDANGPDGKPLQACFLPAQTCELIWGDEQVVEVSFEIDVAKGPFVDSDSIKISSPVNGKVTVTAKLKVRFPVGCNMDKVERDSCPNRQPLELGDTPVTDTTGAIDVHRKNCVEFTKSDGPYHTECVERPLAEFEVGIPTDLAQFGEDGLKAFCKALNSIPGVNQNCNNIPSLSSTITIQVPGLKNCALGRVSRLNCGNYEGIPWTCAAEAYNSDP